MYLPGLLVPQRFNAIRSLQFTWYVRDPPILGGRRYNDISWVTIWHVFASMQGLRKLRVELEISPLWQAQWAECESTVFEPVKAVTTPCLFDLVLPFRGSTNRLPDLPCTIQRI